MIELGLTVCKGGVNWNHLVKGPMGHCVLGSCSPCSSTGPTR